MRNIFFSARFQSMHRLGYHNLQVGIVRNVLCWFVDILCKASGIPWTSSNGGWMLVSELSKQRKSNVFYYFSIKKYLLIEVVWNQMITFRQSWKTAKPTEMTNEKNDNWRALNALIPKMPRPNGTSVMIFNKMKVKIGMATFFSFDFRDSTTPSLLNLTLKSTSSFCKLRAEMVSLLSATGKSNETSLRWT